MDAPNPFHVAFAASADMLRQLPPTARREMYARARRTLAEAVEAEVDPERSRLLLQQARQLEKGVRAFEDDVRSGRADLRRAPPPGGAPRPSGRGAPVETALFPHLGPDPAPPPRPRRALAAGLAARGARIQALAWRHARLTAAGGPLAYLWILVEPAVPILFVTAFYLLLGRTEVFDMPTPAFVVLGIGSWFVYRAIFVRLSAGHGADAQLLRLPRLTDFDLFASKAVFFAVLYALILAGLLGGLTALGMVGPPDRLLAVLGLLGCLVALGFSHGVAFCLLARRFPPVLKVRMLLLRVLYIASGAMYVTEQFPDPLTRYLLYNPFLHCIQLIRDAYFRQYQTGAASLEVVLAFTLVSLAVGLACQRVLGRMPRPA